MPRSKLYFIQKVQINTKNIPKTNENHSVSHQEISLILPHSYSFASSIIKIRNGSFVRLQLLFDCLKLSKFSIEKRTFLILCGIRQFHIQNSSLSSTTFFSCLTGISNANICVFGVFYCKSNKGIETANWLSTQTQI